MKRLETHFKKYVISVCIVVEKIARLTVLDARLETAKANPNTPCDETLGLVTQRIFKVSIFVTGVWTNQRSSQRLG